jgi:hypothetical protein
MRSGGALLNSFLFDIWNLSFGIYLLPLRQNSYSVFKVLNQCTTYATACQELSPSFLSYNNIIGSSINDFSNIDIALPL